MPLMRASGAGRRGTSRHRLPLWLFVAWVCLSIGVLPLWAGWGKKKPKHPEQFANISFLVLRDSDGKPLRNASVIIHFLREDGSEGDGLQLKTGPEGKASITDIPYGKIRLQAIAPGLRTYGEDVEVNAAEQQFVIRLQPPAAQVSAYE